MRIFLLAMRIFLLATSLFALRVAFAAPKSPSSKPQSGAVSAVVARQDVKAEDNNVFRAADSMSVAFELKRAAPVTVSVFQDRAFGLAARWYAHPANLVGRFSIAGKAGAQSYIVKLADLKASGVALPYPLGFTDAKRGPLPLSSKSFPYPIGKTTRAPFRLLAAL